MSTGTTELPTAALSAMEAELARAEAERRQLFGDGYIGIDEEDDFSDLVEEEPTPVDASKGKQRAAQDDGIVLPRYDDTTLGDAFVEAHPELVWNSSRLIWMRYDETKGIWREYSTPAAELLIDEFLKKVHRDGEEAFGKDDFAAAKWLGGQRTQEAVAKKIKTKNHVAQEQFDADPFRRVFANGVFDPRNPGVMEPFDPKLYSTRCAPLSYDPDAKHDRLKDALSPLPDDAHEWFQLMAGQSLLGFQPAAEFAIFMYGPTASNGKSLLFDLMEGSIGKYEEGHDEHCGYFGRPSEGTLLGGENYDLVSYEGLSQAGIEEMPDKMIHSSPFKRLIGTDSFKGRQIREKHRVIHNRATLWITVNILPSYDTSDQGVIRRMKVIPFDKKFVDTERELALYPKGMAYLKDPSLKEMAKKDKTLQAAFLAWRMEGAIRWCATSEAKRAQLEGAVPASVQQATDRWLNREDTIHGWLQDTMIFDPIEDKEGNPLQPVNFCLATDLYDSYSGWLRANGHAYSVKLNTFFDRFEQNGTVQRHRLEKVKGRVGGLKHSKLIKADGEYATAGATPRHVKGIRFRTELDDQQIESVDPKLTAEESKQLAILDLLRQARAAGISLDDLASARQPAPAEEFDGLEDDLAELDELFS